MSVTSSWLAEVFAVLLVLFLVKCVRKDFDSGNKKKIFDEIEQGDFPKNLFSELVPLYRATSRLVHSIDKHKNGDKEITFSVLHDQKKKLLQDSRLFLFHLQTIFLILTLINRAIAIIGFQRACP